MKLHLFLMHSIVLISTASLMSCGGGGGGGDSKGSTFDIRSSTPLAVSSISSTSLASASSLSSDSQSSAPKSSLSSASSNLSSSSIASSLQSSLSSSHLSSLSSSSVNSSRAASSSSLSSNVSSSQASTSSSLTSSNSSKSSSSLPSITVLPVEVLAGVPGLIEPATILMQGSPSSASYLWLKTHRLTWREDGEFAMKFNGSVRPGSKGSVRLNGGPWVQLMNGNTAVSCEDHEAAYGCLNGTYMTVRIRVAINALGSPGLKTGNNTLEFRFDATDGVSSGWRVLAMDVRNANGQTLLTDNFVQDNPDDWQPPLNNPSDIAAGDTLWSTGALTDSGQTPINGKCASCHESEAYDLKYFNYSNKSIIARSMFHGLSEQQGKQIASYVRSLDSRLPQGVKISEAGRPWNPPYQPGPGLDSKPVELWAAGAGVDAVLENDSMMKEFMFPNGNYDPAKLGATGFLNPRETPHAIQLIDWNGWLPTMALEDMVKYPNLMVPYAGDTPPAEDAQTPLDRLKAATQWLENYRYTGMETDDWFRRHGMFLIHAWGQSRWRGNGMPGTPLTPTEPLARSRQGLAFGSWYAIRMWEMMKKYKLEEFSSRTNLNLANTVTDLERGTVNTGSTTRGIPANFRAWPMQHRVPCLSWRPISWGLAEWPAVVTQTVSSLPNPANT